MLKADLSCVPHSGSELHIISSLETPGYQDISEYQQPWPHSNSVKQFISLTEKLRFQVYPLFVSIIIIMFISIYIHAS